MKAVANGQLRDCRNLTTAYPEGPEVPVDRGTDQEPTDDHARVLADWPDTLLTNSMMVACVLARLRGRGFVEAARACSS